MLGTAGGGVAIRGSEKPCKPEELTARMKAFLEALKPQVELAEKRNSYLAIENHGHALLDSIDSLKAFTDLNKHPRLGIALAPYHIQAGKMSVEEAIAACGKQLLFFYAWQHGKGTEQLPGHGPTDFTPWLAALAKIGYSRYVNPFMHGELEPDEMTAAVAKSRQYMLDCYAKAVRG
ncbi:MAG: TIM barrel protein [Verrucomicrobia bacterium]|nr:TIM barrel protein [Verrucomicrobiota bacterium]